MRCFLDWKWYVRGTSINKLFPQKESVSDGMLLGVFQREEAFLRAQKEADRKRQERELLHIQEEQERLQRKKVSEIYTFVCFINDRFHVKTSNTSSEIIQFGEKHSHETLKQIKIRDKRLCFWAVICLFWQRIEEIMKRTRKSEVEPLSGAAGEC